MDDSPLRLLKVDWLVSLHGIAHPDQIPYFEQFVHRTAAHYAR